MQLILETLAVFFMVFFASDATTHPLRAALSMFSSIFFIFSFNKYTVANLMLTISLMVTK